MISKKSGISVGMRMCLFAVYNITVALCVLPVLVVCAYAEGQPALQKASPVTVSASPPKNVILINIDTLRGDRLGFNGYQRNTSPFLDELAAEGALFRRCYSTWPQTKPSVASLMTGLYPSAHGTTKRPNVSLGLPTLAESLRDAGYITAAVVTNPHLSPGFGFDQGFGTYIYIRTQYKKSAAKKITDTKLEVQEGTVVQFREDKGTSGRGYASGESVNAAALEWVDQYQDSDPYFLYLHYMDVHSPYVSPEPYRSMFVEEVARNLYRNGPPEEEVTARDLEYMNAIYDGQIRYLDHLISNLFEALGSRGRLKETMVIVVADHGDEFLEHGGFGHGASLHHELTYVPLFFWGQGTKQGVHDQVASIIDLFPTICDLLGLPAPPAQGKSLARQVREGQNAVDRPLVFTECGSARDASGARTPQIGVISEDWYLLHRFQEGETRLYDQRSDKMQVTDVSHDHPELVQDMINRASALFEESRLIESGVKAEQVDYDEETIEALRALGYLGG
jgi:arylsulfatase A-like enzyme